MTINEIPFDEMPGSCGTCAAFMPSAPRHTDGNCVFFGKYKRRYDNVPKRCQKLFDKAFKIGGDVVIVTK